MLPFFHQEDVIVFQGDSITEGGRWREAEDYNHIMGQDYAYILAAKIGAEYPERHLNFINRGVSGDRVLDLAARWQSDTLALKPNLLSILVGINDTLYVGPKGETFEEYEQAYDKLLAQTMTALPHVKIVLGQPFLLPVGKHQVNYAAELAEVRKRQAVVERLAAKYHLPFVRYQDVFDTALQRAPADHWSWDGVHPTYAGHWLMMQAWLQTASTFWPDAQGATAPQ
ncbi:SGNH/GDSL hydrolase family protein [Acidobacterium sp. S8]|uniref:SGNH/GDSL hydrolase family protein n=1 Tax=Acidobacterium sp. S8 TaxID=1641854 RepID=UPI001C20568D|nr:SGNH/GDSL hydrolase family protein [Acidobacterium sp. S8]